HREAAKPGGIGRKSVNVRQQIFADAKAGTEMKAAAPTQFALRAELAAHHLRQPLRNCQSQSRAVLPPSERAVHLHERREDAFEFFGRNSNAGVENLEVQ